MNPREVLDALRLALASGAIEVNAHGGPYPCDVQMYGNGDSLFLKWNGADIKFSCQDGAIVDEPLVKTNGRCGSTARDN